MGGTDWLLVSLSVNESSPRNVLDDIASKEMHFSRVMHLKKQNGKNS